MASPITLLFVRLSRLLWPMLKERHGSVINIIGGYVPARPILIS